MSFQTPIFQNLCSVLVTVGHDDSWKHLGKKKKKKEFKSISGQMEICWY